jgi:hypothetical protein
MPETVDEGVAVGQLGEWIVGGPAFEFGFEGLALGYVGGDSDHAREVSSVVKKGRGGAQNGHVGAILASEQRLARPSSSRPQLGSDLLRPAYCIGGSAPPSRTGAPLLLPVDSRFRGNDG